MLWLVGKYIDRRLILIVELVLERRNSWLGSQRCANVYLTSAHPSLPGIIVAQCHGRRKGDGGRVPAVKRLRGNVPPDFSDEVAQIRCLFRFLVYFGVGWPHC